LPRGPHPRLVWHKCCPFSNVIRHHDPLVFGAVENFIVPSGFRFGIGQPLSVGREERERIDGRHLHEHLRISEPPEFSTGAVRISAPDPGLSWEKASLVPLWLKDVGNCASLLCVRACGLPEPSARVQNIPPAATKTRKRPSGVHKGAWLTRIPFVKRVLLPRCRSLDPKVQTRPMIDDESQPVAGGRQANR
jgi:hypothetical protein